MEIVAMKKLGHRAHSPLRYGWVWLPRSLPVDVLLW